MRWGPAIRDGLQAPRCPAGATESDAARRGRQPGTPGAPAQRELLGHLAHELKSPLHTIGAYAEMLQEGSVDPAARNEFFAVITSESQRLATLIDTLVDLSNIEAGALVPQRGPVRIDALVKELVGTFDTAARGKAIDVVVSSPGPIPAVLADSQLLAVALRNLLANAIQYTPRGGRVEVRVGAARGTITVEIADSGIGIHPDDRPQVFDKFFRGRAPEVRQQPGSGLGLALAERLVALHGGGLEVESAPGVGSTFRLTLPGERAVPSGVELREAR